MISVLQGEDAETKGSEGICVASTSLIAPAVISTPGRLRTDTFHRFESLHYVISHKPLVSEKAIVKSWL